MIGYADVSTSLNVTGIAISPTRLSIFLTRLAFYSEVKMRRYEQSKKGEALPRTRTIAYVTEEKRKPDVAMRRIYVFYRIASTNASASNSSKSSIFSPTPAYNTGRESSCDKEKIKPPFAVPSNFVNTIPSNSIASSNTLA